MEKQSNVPRLRFPGFEGEWRKMTLNDITSWASGGTPSKDNLSYWDGEIPWISASSMRGTGYGSSEVKITDEGLRNGSKLARKGSLLILVRGSMLYNSIPVGIATRDVAFNQDVKSIVVHSECNNKFLLQWFLSSEPVLMNMVTGTGIGAGKIDLADLKALKISLPSLPEQQKIVSFLTAIDEKLQLLKKKKSLLEQYKKGMMQKIFSQELRFKPDGRADGNGEEFPDWDFGVLGDVSDKIMYGMNAAAIPYDGRNKYLRITDIDEDTHKFSPSPLTSPTGPIEDKYKLRTGDLVFARTGASVGKSYIYDEADGDLYFAGFLIKFSIIKSNAYFIYTQTLHDTYSKWVQLMSMRSGQPGINAEEYKSYPIVIPSLEEQTKIANFLSAIDEKINHCAKQIEKLAEWKKGLLQQLFC